MISSAQASESLTPESITEILQDRETCLIFLGPNCAITDWILQWIEDDFFYDLACDLARVSWDATS